jgi:hypothetical protein
VTRSDATDHHDRSRLGPLLTRWPLPPLLTATAVLTTAALVLALAAPTGRGITDPHGPAQASGRLAPALAQRAQAQATADRFARVFARSLRRPLTEDRWRAAGASPALARAITTTPSRTAPRGQRTPKEVGRSGGARALDVVVQPDQRGWLATATVLLAEPGRPTDDGQRLSLTFRLEHHRDAPARLVVVDANSGRE